MIRRTSFAVVACFAVLLAAPASGAEEGIKLEYKFKPGEVVRYKMVLDMNMALQSNMPRGGQIPPIQVRMVGVMRQKTLRVLSDGNAELRVAVESMKVNVGGQIQKLPLDKIPTITLILSPRGVVKKLSGLDEAAGLFAGMPFAGSASAGQCGAFPSHPLKVGDVWTENIPFPAGGALRTHSRLASTNSKVGKYRVVTIKQDVGGNIDLAMPGLTFVPAAEASQGSVDVSMKGDVTGDSTVHFSAEHGRLIRTQGTVDAQVAMNVSGSMASGQMLMDMDIKFEMFLLPGK